jgi:hypothetical protein
MGEGPSRRRSGGEYTSDNLSLASVTELLAQSAGKSEMRVSQGRPSALIEQWPGARPEAVPPCVYWSGPGFPGGEP